MVHEFRVLFSACIFCVMSSVYILCCCVCVPCVMLCKCFLCYVVKGENTRRAMLDEQEGTLDYSRPENTALLIFRHVKDSWVKEDGVKEVFLGEVISCNPKINKYLALFSSTGDDEPLPWEYSVSELIKILSEDDTNLIS